MSEPKGYNRRMGDRENIPEMNGTIKALVGLIGASMGTPELQEQALRESIKVQLHTYILQQQVLEEVSSLKSKMDEFLEERKEVNSKVKELDSLKIEMNKLLEERKSIISKLIDKALIPFLYFVGAAVLWLIVTHSTVIP